MILRMGFILIDRASYLRFIRYNVFCLHWVYSALIAHPVRVILPHINTSIEESAWHGIYSVLGRYDTSVR